MLTIDQEFLDLELSLTTGAHAELEGDIMLFKTLFAYQGFNAEVIRACLKLKEPDARKRITEIMEICTLVLTRGTSVTQVGKERMAPLGKARLAELKRKYGIVPKLIKESATDKTLTVSRIAAAHPEIAYTVLGSRGIDRPVSVDFMIAKGFPDFPPTLRGNYVICVIIGNFEYS